MKFNNNKNSHLITGATGLIGSALALELLSKTEDDVIAVVRPGAEGAQWRIENVLKKAAVAYGLDPATLPLERVRGVAGDITQPCCDVQDDVKANFFWHSAASLRFENRFESEIFQTNVGGARNALALAKKAGAEVFNDFSTAYVSGDREGVLKEEPVEDVQSNNHYERSKVEAEALMLREKSLQVRIFRPSIVVGHSHTLAVTTFSGMYGFVRQMYQFRRILERTQQGLYRDRPMKLRMTLDGLLDLAPVNAVVEQAVYIGTQADSHGIYHLTQPNSPKIGDVANAIFDELGFAPPVAAEEGEELDWLDTRLNKQLDFYSSYIRGRRSFDRTRVNKAMEGHTGLMKKTAAPREMVQWYLPHLEQERAEVRSAR